jgi:hypothetical protein
LDEPISNILQVTEPPELTARVSYSYRDGSFIPYKNILPFITLIDLKTTLIHSKLKKKKLKSILYGGLFHTIIVIRVYHSPTAKYTYYININNYFHNTHTYL